MDNENIGWFKIVCHCGIPCPSEGHWIRHKTEHPFCVTNIRKPINVKLVTRLMFVKVPSEVDNNQVRESQHLKTNSIDTHEMNFTCKCGSGFQNLTNFRLHTKTCGKASSVFDTATLSAAKAYKPIQPKKPIVHPTVQWVCSCGNAFPSKEEWVTHQQLAHPTPKKRK